MSMLPGRGPRYFQALAVSCVAVLMLANFSAPQNRVWSLPGPSAWRQWATGIGGIRSPVATGGGAWSAPFDLAQQWTCGGPSALPSGHRFSHRRRAPLAILVADGWWRVCWRAACSFQLPAPAAAVATSVSPSPLGARLSPTDSPGADQAADLRPEVIVSRCWRKCCIPSSPGKRGANAGTPVVPAGFGDPDAGAGPGQLQVLGAGMAQGLPPWRPPAASRPGVAGGDRRRCLIRSSPGVFGTLRYAGAASIGWLAARLRFGLVVSPGLAAVELLAAIYRRARWATCSTPLRELCSSPSCRSSLKPEAGGRKCRWRCWPAVHGADAGHLRRHRGFAAAPLAALPRPGPGSDPGRWRSLVAVALRLAFGV